MKHDKLLSTPRGRLLTKGGFSVVEALLAGSLLLMLVTAIVGALLYGEESAVISGARGQALSLADEGLEALRNIRDENFTNLIDGMHGLATSSNQWVFSGTGDSIGIFTRNIEIGTVNSNTKLATATVTWSETPLRQGSVSLVTRLTNWQLAFERGGMLVYGDGGTTSDVIRYRIIDGTAGTWGSVQSAADIDGATANRALRAVQVYASPARNEKVMVSRHYNGTTQYIYAQVFNGVSWGNVVLLSNWNAATFLDVHNFSGAYLVNGDFMIVYSDNTAVPKFRVWNGISWGSQIALPNTGGIPAYIVARARPSTNEIMAAFFDQSSDTNTAYFNGVSYITANWTLHAEHSAAAPVNTKKLIDFAWSPNNLLKGALVYSNSGTDVSMNIKIWTANGAGGGAWSATANTSNQASRLGAMTVSGRRGADEFVACDKDANATPRIICYRSTFGPVWSNPTNQIIAASTDTGIQPSYDMSFESAAGLTAVAVYSDGTAVPKLKKYNATSQVWDAAPTNITPLGAALETVRLIPHPDTDDLMVLLGDTSQDFYSLVWDGATDSFYSVPAGKTFTAHGVSGVADESLWFDFAWDRF